jgi:nicotinamidase/pyrazinamidase
MKMKKQNKKVIIFWDEDTQRDFMDKDGALYVPNSEKIKPNLKKLTEYALKNNIPILGSVDEHFGKEIYKDRESELQRWGGPFPDHCMFNTTGQLKIPETTPWPAYGKEADCCTVNGNDYGIYVDHQLYHKHPLKPIPEPVVEARKKIGLSEQDIEKEWQELITGVNKEQLNELVGYFKQIYQGERQKGIYFEKQTYDVFSNPMTEKFLNKVKVKEAVVYGVATDICVRAAVLGMQQRDIQCYLVTDAIKGVFPDKTQKALEEMVKAGAKLITTKNLLEKTIPSRI